MCNYNCCWDIRKGDVLYIGSKSFDAKDLDRFSTKGDKAIQSLCKKVLNSEEGRRIASEAYGEIQGGRLSLDPVTRAPRYEYITRASKKEGLSFSVAFDEMKGLLLFVQGVEHTIASAKEVFSGKGSYFEEIKKISDDSSRRKIGAVRSSVFPLQDEDLKTVYKQVIEDKKEEAQKPVTPFPFGKVEMFFRSKINLLIDKIFGSKDLSLVMKSSDSALAPSSMCSFGVGALLGGIVLGLGGFYAAMASAGELGVAILHRSFEKGCLAFVNVVSSFCMTMTGILFWMKGIGYFAKDIATSASIGMLLPFFVFGMFVSGFFSSLYKVYVSYSFRREIQKILEQNEGSEEEKLYEAIRWVQQKLELSECEYLANVEKGEQKNTTAFQQLRNAFHEKLDRFALRVGPESYEVLKEFLPDGKVSEILQGIKENDSSKIGQGKELVTKVLDKNKEQIIWSIIGTIYNLIGAVGMVIYLSVVGPAGSIASSVIFGLAAFLSFFVDLQVVKNLAKRCFYSLRENVRILSEAIISVSKDPDRVDDSLHVSINKVIRSFARIKHSNSENFQNQIK